MGNFKTIMESWRGFKSVLNERTIPEKDYPRTFQELQSAYKEFEGKTLIFFDTETTGLEMEKGFSAITQLAAIKVDGSSLLGEGDVVIKQKFDKRITLSDTTAIEILRQEKNWKFRLQKYNEEKEAFEKEEQNKKDLDSNYEMRKFFRPKPFSIAMAFSMTGYKTMQELEDELGSPVVSVEPSVEENNPAYAEENRTYLVPSEVLNGFVEFCSPTGKNVLIAQNAPFDVKYVNIAFRRAGLQVPDDFVVDTAVIFRKYLVPVLTKFKKEIDTNEEMKNTIDKDLLSAIETLFTNYDRYTKEPKFTVSLGKVTKAFGVPDEGWHNALADVVMLAKVMKKINNFLLKYPEETSTISYEDPIGPTTESEAEILKQIEEVENEINSLNAQGIGGDSPIDDPGGKGYTTKQGIVVKPDSSEYAEYAKTYEPLEAAQKKLTSLKARLKDIRDPETAEKNRQKRREQDAARRAAKKDTPPISESKIRIKIKR